MISLDRSLENDNVSKIMETNTDGRGGLGEGCGVNKLHRCSAHIAPLRGKNVRSRNTTEGLRLLKYKTGLTTSVKLYL